MALKPMEIIAGGALVLTGLANMKANKKWIPWVLVAAGFGVIAAVFWSPDEATKTIDNHQQIAAATAPGATVINAATGAKVITGPTLEEIKEAMRGVQNEKEPDLRKEFPLGYILFTATERQQIVPLESPFDDIIKFDWHSHYSVTFHEKSVEILLPDITFLTAQDGLNVLVGMRVEMPNTPGFRFPVYGTSNIGLSVVYLSSNSVGVIMAIGLKRIPWLSPTQ